MNSGEEVILGGKRRRQVQAQGQPRLKKQKHLYLVLDDWYDGFTIRKIDADDEPDLISDLSEPPVARLASPAPMQGMFFTALGSHILAVSNQHPVSLVYDTATGAVAPGPSLPDALLNGHDMFVPTADKLCAFGFYMLRRPPSAAVMSSSASATERHPCSPLIPCKHWSWRSVRRPPFTEDERIRSYAVHPDGRTVFVSSQFCCVRDDRCRTFSFDVENRDEWRCHGEWELPFEGHGYFDSDLDAWVGLRPDGYIGTCQVPSRGTSSGATAAAMRPQLDWKMAKEKLWSKEERQAACEPTLTCMGNARFCLVSSVGEVELSVDCTLRLTTFRLRHSRKGELQIIDRSTSECPVSRCKGSFSPVAFWM